MVFELQREQMLEAQEMFRTANKVTRPEKALILGFMAGSRGTSIFHVYLSLKRIYICIYISIILFVDCFFCR